jgi:tetratricopeptide (TPR) repeat protein
MATVGEDPAALGFALSVLGTAELQLGELAAARQTLQRSIEAHRRGSDRNRLAKALGNLAGIEEELGDVTAAESHTLEALRILEDLGDEHEAAVQRQNLAHLLAVAGRVDEAEQVAQELVATVLRLRSPSLTMAFANTYMNILLRTGDPAQAAELFGAEEQMHERLAMPNPYQEEELAEAMALTAGSLTSADWDRHREVGRATTVEALLRGLASRSES